MYKSVISLLFYLGLSSSVLAKAIDPDTCEYTAEVYQEAAKYKVSGVPLEITVQKAKEYVKQQGLDSEVESVLVDIVETVYNSHPTWSSDGWYKNTLSACLSVQS